MSLLKRKIDLTFRLGKGQFGESGVNQVKVTGLRVSSKIVKPGGLSQGQANLQIYGMTKSTMNQLATLGRKLELVNRNEIVIEAGDDENGMAIVFTGNIINGYIDTRSAPDVAFVVHASQAYLQSVKPSGPRSYPNSFKVADALSGLAKEMGANFENNGVDTMLPSSYFYGSQRDQAVAMVKAANIDWNGLDNGVLAIWPRGKSRKPDSTPPVIKPPAMRGYPTYTSNGIIVSTIFNRALEFGLKVNVESDQKPATGIFRIIRLDHDLDSMVPRGQWFSTVYLATLTGGPVKV